MYVSDVYSATEKLGWEQSYTTCNPFTDTGQLPTFDLPPREAGEMQPLFLM